MKVSVAKPLDDNSPSQSEHGNNAGFPNHVYSHPAVKFGSSQRSRKPKWSTARKVCVGFVGGSVVLLLLCGGLGTYAYKFLEQSVIKDPIQISLIASETLDFELPDGFEPDGGIAVLESTLIIFKKDHYPLRRTIWIYVAGRRVDKEQYREAVIRDVGMSSNGGPTPIRVGKLVNGKGCGIVAELMTYKSGDMFFVTHAVFDAKNGNTAALLHVVPESLWDKGGSQESLNLINSMR